MCLSKAFQRCPWNNILRLLQFLNVIPVDVALKVYARVSRLQVFAGGMGAPGEGG